MASKLSLTTLCFCTIFDLTYMIDFCVRALSTLVKYLVMLGLSKKNYSNVPLCHVWDLILLL